MAFFLDKTKRTPSPWQNQVKVGPGQTAPDPTQQLAQAMGGQQQQPPSSSMAPLDPKYGDLAKAMISQGTSTAPVSGRLEGIARPLEALAGVYLQRKQGAFDREMVGYREQQLAQALGGIQDPATRTQIMAAFRASPELGAAQYGQATAPPKYENVPDVGLVQVPTRQGGAPPSVAVAAGTPLASGYQRTPDGGQEPVKGGPADPATLERNANATRDPMMLEQTYNPATQSMQTLAIPRAQVTAAMQGGQTGPNGQGAVVGQAAPNEQVQRNAKLAVEGQNAANAAIASILNPDGTINRSTVATLAVNFPGSQGREARAQFDTALANLVYIKSGAQAGPAEIASARAQYLPSPLDSDQTVRDKMTRLQAVFAQSIPAGSQPAAGLPAGVTEADIQETMRANNMTREQVMQRLAAH